MIQFNHREDTSKECLLGHIDNPRKTQEIRLILSTRMVLPGNVGRSLSFIFWLVSFFEVM